LLFPRLVVGHRTRNVQCRHDTTVLILGETGVGKELIARRIHHESHRRRAPMITVNCASIPRDLFESEFFGHARGAFTGATRDRAGRVEAADGGSLFLDEVGEIPLELQGKLLRTLQDESFERVGEDRTRQANVRFIAATNRNLVQETSAGRFRLDLYYRLSVFPIEFRPEVGDGMNG
jgi:transcriptional regulator with GAF, ATPase, and Fis domain